MIDILALIKEFKNMDIDTSMYISSDLEYEFNVASSDLLAEELNIIKKYANIQAIKMNNGQFTINLEELDQ